MMGYMSGDLDPREHEHLLALIQDEAEGPELAGIECARCGERGHTALWHHACMVCGSKDHSTMRDGTLST